MLCSFAMLSVALLLALIIVFSILGHAVPHCNRRLAGPPRCVQSVVTCMCFAATMPLIVGGIRPFARIDDRLSGDALPISASRD